MDLIWAPKGRQDRPHGGVAHARLGRRVRRLTRLTAGRPSADGQVNRPNGAGPLPQGGGQIGRQIGRRARQDQS